MRFLASCLLGLGVWCGSAWAHAAAFADNPIVYFLITDRFANGNRGNDQSYGRSRDGESEAGTFHGGDLAGVTQKLKAGWFKALGVNAIWITAPYEQIHGWVVGGSQEFKHYAYHGYYAADFTVLDKNMGTPDELREMISTAHQQGIRVLFDVVMNHPGYLDIQSARDFKIDVLWKGNEAATLKDYHSYIDYNRDRKNWARWWGGAWTRSGLPGYADEGKTDFTKQLAHLPDFRTESSEVVRLPPFLRDKKDTRAVELPNATVRDYLVSWLSSWVRDYGVDGFRCDTVKHVEPEAWRALKQASTEALVAWKAAHPLDKIDDQPFWMVGEYWGQDTARTAIYDAGFDAMINFDFQDRVEKAASLEPLYADYAAVLADGADYNVLSYLSSHDTRLFDRSRLREAGTALMLAPGGVQIFYGDESGRPAGAVPASDPQQATRSDMNWQSLDTPLLAHWRKLGQFRARHVALARGQHQRIQAEPYVFARVMTRGGDRVVVAPAVTGEVELPVGTTFDEGAVVIDAYSGRPAVVANGRVKLKAEGTVLLELAD